jgi:AcrR family transcriptional regulator
MGDLSMKKTNSTQTAQRKRGQRGKGRRKGEGRVTEEEILDTALQVFGRQGFVGTSMQSIASFLDVSQSAVMYYFPSKHSLFKGCISLVQHRNWARVENVFLPEDNALVRLRKHFHANLQWAVEAPDEAQIIVLLYALAVFDSEISAINTQVFQVGRKRVFSLLLAGQREKIFRSDLDAQRCAEILHDSLVAGILSWLTTRKGPKGEVTSLAETRAKWDALIAICAGAQEPG